MSDSTQSTGAVVTVGIFPEPASAQVARAVLEAEGIPAFLQGENANGLLPVAFSSRLQVRAEDEAAARKVLAGAERQPASQEEVLEAEIADERSVE